jgi:hypothetical protein
LRKSKGELGRTGEEPGRTAKTRKNRRRTGKNYEEWKKEEIW